MAATKVVKFWAVCLAVLGKLLATFRYAAPGAAACRRAARYGDSLYGATPYTRALRTTAYVPIAPYAPAPRTALGAPRAAATAPPVPVTAGDTGPAPAAPTTATAARTATTTQTAPAPAPAPAAVTPAARRAPEDHFPEGPPAPRTRPLSTGLFLPSPRIADPYVPEMRAYGGPQLPPTIKQRIRAEAHGSSPTTRSRLATGTEPSRTVPADDPHADAVDEHSAATVPAARSREHTACTT